jgi:hypothetical protein
MSFTFHRRIDITDPDDTLAWPSLEGGLRDFTGWTLSMDLIDPVTNVIEYHKTDGIAGGDGTGQSNVAIAWTTAEMTPLAGLKRWNGRILAVSGSEQAEFVLDAQNTLPVWVFEPAPTEPEP